MGVQLIERFYHVTFWSLDEAKAYLKAMKKHNSESKLSIQVYNWKKISSTGWFQANMKAIELSSGDTEKGYSAFVDSHIENLQKLCGSDAEVNA